MQLKQAFIEVNQTKTAFDINEIVIYATYVGKTKLLLLNTLLVEPEMMNTQNIFYNNNYNPLFCYQNKSLFSKNMQKLRKILIII